MKQTFWATILLIVAAIMPGSTFGQTASDSLSIIHAPWQRTRIARGLHTRHTQVPMLYGGPQDIYIVEVNLRRHRLEVADHQGRALTTEVAVSRKAIAAINGTYFNMAPNGRSVCLLALQGKAHDFTASDISLPCNGAVVIKSHGHRSSGLIRPWDAGSESGLYPDSIGQSSLRQADVMVSGPLMLSDGRTAQFGGGSHNMGSHPRSAIAFRGHKAYLVVVDGRDPTRASGVTIPQLAHLLRVMGMRDALNLDGGGSSILWARPTTNAPITAGILNHPSDGHERSVSSSIVVK